MNLVLKEVQHLVGNISKFVFTSQQPLAWKAGQYMHYVLAHSDADDRGDERWFTIASAPHENEIWITTRVFDEHGSSFKHALSHLEVGQTIEADGVEGDFVVDDPDHSYVFVAGGIGITPFRSILTQLDFENKPINVELLYANRDERDIPFKEELEALSARYEHFHITYFIGDNHIDEQALTQVVERTQGAHFYLSGPEPMVAALKAEVQHIGIPDERIKIDDFPGYETI